VAVVRSVLAIALAVLLLAPAAEAAERVDILRDCQDGSLSGNYTPAEIRDARHNIPADIDQYSDCRDVLTRALIPTSGGSGGSGGTSGGGGGSDGAGGAGGTGSAVTGGGAGLGAGAPAVPLTPSGPEEQAALAEAARSGGDEPLPGGTGRIVPGASGFDAGAARHTLPGSLFVTLVLLAVAAVAATAPVLRRRVVRRRPA
jgi:hypothetical protein